MPRWTEGEIRYHDQLCAFGGGALDSLSSAGLSHTSSAQALGPKLATCISPAAELAALAYHTSIDFSSDGVSAPNASLLGAAHLCSSPACSTLVLTQSLTNSVGSLLVPAPAIGTNALRFFRADITVQRSHGAAGEGFSWNYAPPRLEQVGAQGTRDGLSILFLEHPVTEIKVYLHSKLLRHFHTPNWFGLDGVARCTVSVDTTGLHVDLLGQGRILYHSIASDGWQPRQGWSLGIGASSGVHRTSYELQSLKIAFGTRVVARQIRLGIVSNGQQVSVDGASFTYFAVPLISSLTPSHGPEAGLSRVVIQGTNLGNGSDYMCSFGNQLVLASFDGHLGVIVCRTPMLPAGRYLLAQIGCSA